MAWIKELALGIALLAALNAGLAPDDPGLLSVSPHPLLAVVAVVAVRHGAAAGAGAGLAAALVHVAAQLAVAAAAAGGLGAAADRLSAGVPLALLFSGGVLGEIRRRQAAREELDRHRASEVRTEREALRTRLAIADHARRELERRLLDPAAGMAVLYEAAQRLESLDEAALYPGILDIAASHLGATRCSIYALEVGKLRLRAFRGPAAPPEERDAATGLAGIAIRERRVATARDALTVPSAAAEGRQDALLAAPIAAPDGAPIAVIEVTEMPFLSLTSAAQRVLGMLAGWAARAADRARYAKSVREKAIYDEAIGALRYGYFVDRLAEEFERARRYREPFAIVLLEVLGWEAIPPAGREPLQRVLAQVLKNLLRKVDSVFAYKDERSFVATLPHTGPEGVERVRVRLVEEIDRLALEPYRRPGRLEYAIGAVAQAETMTSPADLARAAEEGAAAPSTRPPTAAAAGTIAEARHEEAAEAHGEPAAPPPPAAAHADDRKGTARKKAPPRRREKK